MDLNEVVFRFFNRPGDPVLDAIMIVLTVSGYVYLMALWAVPIWFLGRRRLAVDFLFLILIDMILATFLKSAFALPRPTIGTVLPPFDRDGYGFPSAHATRVFAVAVLLTLRTKDRRGHAVFFAYAILVGISRIYAGVHWPTDVLAGAIFGLAWGYALVRATRLPAYGAARDRVVEWIQGALDRLHIPRGRPESQ